MAGEWMVEREGQGTVRPLGHAIHGEQTHGVVSGNPQNKVGNHRAERRRLLRERASLAALKKVGKRIYAGI